MPDGALTDTSESPCQPPEGTGASSLAPSDAENVEAAVEEEEAFPREAIVALKPWCTACHGSGCTRCALVCPTGAITVDAESGPHIEESLCTRCGLCAGVCDAFAWERITLPDLVTRAERGAREEGMACFTCNECLFPGIAPRANVTVLPCLAAVPPEFWSALFAKGIDVGIYRDVAYCADCATAGPNAAALFEWAIESAEEWTGAQARALTEIPEREGLLSFYAHLNEGDRRDALTKVATEGWDIASGKHRKRNAGTVDGFHEQKERLRARGRINSAHDAAIPALGVSHPVWPRQQLAVEAARALPGRAGLAERYRSYTDASLCERAHCCIAACPTGARTLDEETGLPKTRPSLCIACGACVAACPHGACSLGPTTAQAYLSEDE